MWCVWICHSEGVLIPAWVHRNVCMCVHTHALPPHTSEASCVSALPTPQGAWGWPYKVGGSLVCKAFHIQNIFEKCPFRRKGKTPTHKSLSICTFLSVSWSQSCTNALFKNDIFQLLFLQGGMDRCNWECSTWFCFVLSLLCPCLCWNDTADWYVGDVCCVPLTLNSLTLRCTQTSVFWHSIREKPKVGRPETTVVKKLMLPWQLELDEPSTKPAPLLTCFYWIPAGNLMVSRANQKEERWYPARALLFFF